MSVARSGHTATLLPTGQVLMAGGASCTSGCVYLNTAELYDPNSGTFSPTTGNLSTPYTGAAAILLNTGKVLIAGGSSDGATLNSFAELYDPATSLFTQSGAMVSPRSSFTATLLQNGNVLIAGGAAGATELPAAEIYNPSTGTFASTGSLNIPRQFHTASLLLNGKVLIAGGNSTTNSAELYDPGSGTFSLTGNLGETRWSPTATALPNGTVLIAGGYFMQVLSSIETYDPSAGVFTSQSVFMTVPRTGHATTQLADGRLLLTGGEDATLRVNSSAEIYDPSTEKFSPTGSLIQGRHGHTATLLGDGTVLVVGGYSDTAGPNNGTSVVPIAEIYSPVTETFRQASSNPNVARAYHTATLLPNGKVLIAGGQIPGQQDTSSAELYDPAAETFTLAGNMSGPRYNHTATLLNDGRVLIADGITQAGSPGNGVGPDDVYDPNTGLFTQVGPRGLIDQQTISPFDSVLLADGRVLADNHTIFDPILNTLSTISSLVNLDAILQDYKFVLLPNGQVFATSNYYPTYLFDPASETYTTSASVQYYRTSPTLKLLPNGEVLVAGGAGVAQVEFYVPPVAASNAAPVLTGLSPSSAVAGGAGFTLLVVGSNFVNNSVVNFNGVARLTTFLNAQQLSIAISAGDIANPAFGIITVTNPLSGAGGGGTSNPLTLIILAANVQPVVEALSPASATAGGPAFTLSLEGNFFTPNVVVTFDGTSVTSTFVSVEELQANIPASAIAIAGSPLITVSNPGSGPSIVATFTVNNPVPQENALSPSSAVVGGDAFLLTVTGSNFNKSSSVLVNGTVLTTTFVSSTLVQTTVPSSDLTQGGTLKVSVNNPIPGGGATPALPISVNNPMPQETILSPSSVPAGNAALTLNVTGTNFVQGSTVQVNDTSRTTTFVSPTSLTAALLASDFSHTGMLNVTVNNPNPGGGTTGSLELPVVADFNVSATPQSATVQAGNPANYSLMLAPAKGQLTLNGTVTFSTSPLPPGAQATFTPTNVPAGSAGTNVMLAIATTPHSSGSFVLVTFGEWPHAPLLLGAELAIGMMWFALEALRGSARRLAPLLLILLLLAVASGLTACGISGGGGGSSGPQVNTGTGTPAGNYTITVKRDVGKYNSPHYRHADGYVIIVIVIFLGPMELRKDFGGVNRSCWIRSASKVCVRLVSCGTDPRRRISRKCLGTRAGYAAKSSAAGRPG